MLLCRSIESLALLVFVLFLLCRQANANREVTFTKITSAFNGSMLYQRSIETEDFCLNVCYDEGHCKFVHYSKNNCTLYDSGSITYTPSEVTYELDRKLSDWPTCKKEVPIRKNVQFKPIEVKSTEGVECNGLPKDVTVIFTYLTEGNTTVLMGKSDLFGNFTAMQRLIFSRTPQERCVSVPVFSGASNTKLYFGHVYNTSGYYFMDAYAFSGMCACETHACCGITPLKECNWYRDGKFNGVIYVKSGETPAEIGIQGQLRNSKHFEQQFYIAGVEWL
ncbi:unnamed protein product [Cylicocyclus nassatus]|uniref:Apple domain-containing protein n=1 Tax=Cylicocyclus nassatus TaxID=53992 RepID=A0AA36H3L2_CYLNA|nr:unnamed protein product [Cylicocyclus nassatus]